MREQFPLTAEDLRHLLRLPEEADTARPFDQIGVDSWDLVELRAVLETKFGLMFPDVVWLEMYCPDDIVHSQENRRDV